jgi:phosphate transport system permease protein
VTNAFIAPPIRRWAGGWTRTNFALLELAKFLVACLATLVLAYALSYLLNEFAWDPRGTFVGTYVQRNSLVVGFIMGFAIIPIIYTISDDALSSVPESLRAASLGAGATQWQTALRVVIPTAMSGLFSALMIGLGRAVGETMIVLMAAGNTPLMDWNIFNGFRTLSANIAVELPEAVINSTHYRMLFLAALSLFIMTFAVNTVAEIVRLRFRRRAFQL